MRGLGGDSAPLKSTKLQNIDTSITFAVTIYVTANVRNLNLDDQPRARKCIVKTGMQDIARLTLPTFRSSRHGCNALIGYHRAVVTSGQGTSFILASILRSPLYYGSFTNHSRPFISIFFLHSSITSITTDSVDSHQANNCFRVTPIPRQSSPGRAMP